MTRPPRAADVTIFCLPNHSSPCAHYFVLTIAARMFSVCKAVLNSRALVSCTDRSVEQVETAHVVEDWGTLVSNADSRIVSNEALFVKIGTHLQNIEQSHDDVGNIVRQLRSIRMFSVCKAVLNSRTATNKSAGSTLVPRLKPVIYQPHL